MLNISNFTRINNSDFIMLPQMRKNKNQNFCAKDKTFNLRGIESLEIPNLHATGENGVRGESLSKKGNKKYAPLIKEHGITQIIDLKTTDYSPKFENYINSQGLIYNHYPIDSEKVSAREIIDNLPKMFEQINKGNFYISCAQGLHRTDIAMTLNYFFNPEADSEPPVLYGHKTEKGLRFDDIFRRLNSVFNALTDDDKKKLGIEGYNKDIFQDKKEKLIEANS